MYLVQSIKYPLRVFAIKAVSFKGLTKSDYDEHLTSIEQELKILKSLQVERSPYIVKLYASSFDRIQKKFYFFMDFIQGGDLFY